jgi:uncharacterized cofD-like protein
MKKLVRIGGGSSGYTMLRALKERPLEVTAIVNMFDSGGSSGVLRDELGILPPGDIRRALAALADGDKGEILRQLFNFRFNEGGSVNGHSFGNLFLAALSGIYGSDIEAIRKASELLDLKGTVLPVSLDKSHLHAILADGTEVVGETNIDIPQHDGSLKIERIFLDPSAQLFEDAAAAIAEADTIVMGPGDLYTSIIPNLLVTGMPEALKESKANIGVVCNLMTKWGETHGFCTSDMLRELVRYSELERFDFAICNTGEASPHILETYAIAHQYPMKLDDATSQYAEQVITDDLFSDADIARHDPEKIADILAVI